MQGRAGQQPARFQLEGQPERPRGEGAELLELRAGREPLLHPQIAEIVEGLVARKKYIYLCTNALLLKEKLDLFKPSKYLSFSVHVDGQKEHHDFSVCREGGYDVAVDGIREAVARGFRVTTNTTLFDGADPRSVRAFFDDMMDLGVESMMLSPGYSYDKAPDQKHFLGRARTRRLFREPHASHETTESTPRASGDPRRAASAIFRGMSVTVETGTTVAFDRFWRWLKHHANCIVRASRRTRRLLPTEGCAVMGSLGLRVA